MILELLNMVCHLGPSQLLDHSRVTVEPFVDCRSPRSPLIRVWRAGELRAMMASRVMVRLEQFVLGYSFISSLDALNIFWGTMPWRVYAKGAKQNFSSSLTLSRDLVARGFAFCHLYALGLWQLVVSFVCEPSASFTIFVTAVGNSTRFVSYEGNLSYRYFCRKLESVWVTT